MAQFTDKKSQAWQVNLDPVIADEIRQKHGLNIVDLKQDPLQALRTDPMTLVAVLHLICQEQIAERGMTPEQFAKCLPFPPDPMLTAVEEAVVGFFPTGRASHVREVLASYASMAAKTDELTTAKMQAVLSDPRTMQAVSRKADAEIEKAMRAIDTPPGT